ncbi:putative oxidoreductase (plasmid) [Sinorhizobium fredii NGR234]|uniref:Oxidoreductase n=1 Tax=Sinorhizobium fredii (strain NBRC 101917 / NGR234) TaxID=394 RepID=C3KRJ9_SINFN|nr:FAD-dependent oxidoreductase [Sinorhizobium fredii]ACP22707.1 putative oxidoreductase [Sinorhizobium fredii NGR234]
MVNLPGNRGSCWVAGAGRTGYSPLDGSIHAETVVVGGGIVGLTTALRLGEAGRSVILLEALEIGGQVTGRSTAKITTQHALIYRHLIDALDLAKARRYAEANSAGAALIKDWIREYAIACDLDRKPAYTYATSAEGREAIVAEAEAVRQIGLEAQVLDGAPLPFETTGALCFADQAQFNPAKYLVGLAHAVADRGGRMFERSRAILIGEASRWRVVTAGGTVHAEHVVVATNMTVKSPVGMANRTQPRCHTAMAFRIDDPLAVDGMFIGIDDPTHSIRTGSDGTGPLLVVLGPKFDTGQDGNVAARFVELEEWARRNLAVGEVAWHWCNEDYDTADRVPYVGEPDPEKAPGFHIATGFNAWGISNGTAAGMMIADTILDRASPWRSLYDPTRPYPKDFHKNGDSQSVVSGTRDIRPGEGGVIVRGEEKIAVCRDEDGALHAVSASCTHKGCTVTWNNADRTWDCPCHGSIFALDGSVIHGPARKPLASVEL